MRWSVGHDAPPAGVLWQAPARPCRHLAGRIAIALSDLLRNVGASRGLQIPSRRKAFFHSLCPYGATLMGTDRSFPARGSWFWPCVGSRRRDFRRCFWRCQHNRDYRRDATFPVSLSGAPSRSARQLPQPRQPGQWCPVGWVASGSYCMPGSDKAPQAVPKNGWCPSGGRESGSYCMGLLREGEHWQQHRRDDQSFQHGDCPRPRLLL